MLIDRQSSPWIIAICVIFLAATIAYVPNARSLPNGPSGATTVGLVYGIAGSALMLFALLLGLRKRFRTARVGRVFLWTQGHIWLGLLSYPLIVYHSGFRFGGTFTSVLMWLFTLVVLSGIFGVILQQIVPTKLLRGVPLETVYEQVDHVIAQLLKEADELVEKNCRIEDAGGYATETIAAGSATATLASPVAAAKERIANFHVVLIRTMLVPRYDASQKLADEGRAGRAFQELAAAVPASLHEVVADLRCIVDERRQLAAQGRYQRLLHGWLIVHVPLSYALAVLAAVHVVIALRYR